MIKPTSVLVFAVSLSLGLAGPLLAQAQNGSPEGDAAQAVGADGAPLDPLAPNDPKGRRGQGDRGGRGGDRGGREPAVTSPSSPPPVAAPVDRAAPNGAGGGGVGRPRPDDPGSREVGQPANGNGYNPLDSLGGNSRRPQAGGNPPVVEPSTPSRPSDPTIGRNDRGGDRGSRDAGQPANGSGYNPLDSLGGNFRRPQAGGTPPVVEPSTPSDPTIGRNDRGGDRGSRDASQPANGSGYNPLDSLGGNSRRPQAGGNPPVVEPSTPSRPSDPTIGRNDRGGDRGWRGQPGGRFDPGSAPATSVQPPSLDDRGGARNSSDRVRRDDTRGDRGGRGQPNDLSAPRGGEPRPVESDRGAPSLRPFGSPRAIIDLRDERARSDRDFGRALDDARRQDRERGGRPGARWDRFDDRAASRFEDLRRNRTQRIDRNGTALFEESDRRVIVRGRNGSFIQHSDVDRFTRAGRELRRERRSDGTALVVTLGLGGLQIHTLEDQWGRPLRRSRFDRAGREFVLFDNRPFHRRQFRDRYFDARVDLPPPRVRIPRRDYIVDDQDASFDDFYEALSAPLVEGLDRAYSLEEVRQSYGLREYTRRVDLETINFGFASWDVDREDYPTLRGLADAIHRILDDSPNALFLIEGHTDAVGSELDNLSLSDRRAEAVAIILTEEFDVPPENLVTQGYGERYLKVETEEPSRQNRRVSVRNITRLLSQGSDNR